MVTPDMMFATCASLRSRAEFAAAPKDQQNAELIAAQACEPEVMAGLFSSGKPKLAERRYRVVIEVSYVAGLLTEDLRQMLAADISIPGCAQADVAVVVSRKRASVLVVSVIADAANPRAALSRVDEALDLALMTTGLFEEFDVTGKVLLVAPQHETWRRASRPGTSGMTVG
jgi:hypothetical protein